MVATTSLPTTRTRAVLRDLLRPARATTCSSATAGRHPAPGANGAIALSSPGCVIERNLMVGNGRLPVQAASPPRIDDEKRVEAVWNRHGGYNNVIAFNERAQTAGSSLLRTAALAKGDAEERPEASGRLADNIAADYVAKDSGASRLAWARSAGADVDRPLRPIGQPLFQWGASGMTTTACPLFGTGCGGAWPREGKSSGGRELPRSPDPRRPSAARQPHRDDGLLPAGLRAWGPAGHRALRAGPGARR